MIILGFISTLPFLWLLFLALMSVAAAKDRKALSLPVKIMVYPVLYLAVALDVLFNLTWGTILFLDVPQEWMFTARITRLGRDFEWRGAVARWICRKFLDPFDPSGSHCK